MGSKEIIRKWITNHQEEIIEIYQEILRIPALSPDFGGEGEYDKIQCIVELLESWGFEKNLRIFNVPDQRAKMGVRPNLIVEFNPTNLKEPAVCIVSHVDVVPVGDSTKWDTDPFTPTLKEGKLYGRGSEDNGSGIITSLMALRLIKDLDLVLSNPLKIVFVADEEQGSAYGIKELVNSGEFSKEDIVLVPDSGDSTGLIIEVAEKTPFRAEIIVKGKQGHAAAPDDALNAHRVANELAFNIDQRIHNDFNQLNPLFHPPYSTFEPTKRENPVENINTIPGIDTQFWDCRLIPEHSQEQVKNVFLDEIGKMEGKYKVDIELKSRPFIPLIEPITEKANSVIRLQQAIRYEIQGNSKLVGIGGGTCAYFFRAAGIPAIVWGHFDHCAHQINEFIRIEYLFTDVSIMTHFLLGE